MWKMGTLSIDGERVRYWALVFDEPSDYGIDGGRISKLTVRHKDTCLLNYDRGWDRLPETKMARIALGSLKRMFN